MKEKRNQLEDACRRVSNEIELQEENNNTERYEQFIKDLKLILSVVKQMRED